MAYWLQRIVMRLVVVVIGAALIIGLVQPAAQAARETDAGQQDATPSLQSKQAQERQERRERQSKRSERDEDTGVDSLDELLNDRFNLNEITDDNDLVEQPGNLLEPTGSR